MWFGCECIIVIIEYRYRENEINIHWRRHQINKKILDKRKNQSSRLNGIDEDIVYLFVCLFMKIQWKNKNNLFTRIYFLFFWLNFLFNSLFLFYHHIPIDFVILRAQKIHFLKQKKIYRKVYNIMTYHIKRRRLYDKLVCRVFWTKSEKNTRTDRWMTAHTDHPIWRRIINLKKKIITQILEMSLSPKKKII